ncbi:MAG: hypothetical protein ED557_04365 [Balneola sp.]|nr:MAG: hypothetical protein ED557_04365 [Balneola sp.]
MTNNFDHLTYQRNDDKLSPEFIQKWVLPFYMTHIYNDSFSPRLNILRNELDCEVVRKLLGDFNWRTRSVGAVFAAIIDCTKFEEQIGTLLLKSEMVSAGKKYVLTLATFNTPQSIQYLLDYLDYYLERKDLWYDQDHAMAALKWLDHLNGSNHLDNYIERWNNFITDKPYWNLDQSFEIVSREMTALKRLSKRDL